MCLCHICTHVRMLACMPCMCAQAPICNCIGGMSVRICRDLCLCTSMCTNVTYIHTSRQTGRQEYIHTSIHTYIYTHVNTRIHRCTHAQIHTPRPKQKKRKTTNNTNIWKLLETWPPRCKTFQLCCVWLWFVFLLVLFPSCCFLGLRLFGSVGSGLGAKSHCLDLVCICGSPVDKDNA